MVVFTSSDTFIQQSSLLILARPTTTRITTHYALPRQNSKSDSKSKATSKSDSKPKSDPKTSSTPTTAPAAILTLKTYDPVSGVVLKYETNRAAEVGRLLAALGRLGGVMGSGKEIRTEGGEGHDEAQGQGQGAESAEVIPVHTQMQTPQNTSQTQTQTQTNTGGGGGKGKGKKKGKR